MIEVPSFFWITIFLYTSFSARGGEWVVVYMHLPTSLINLFQNIQQGGGCRPYGPPSYGCLNYGLIMIQKISTSRQCMLVMVCLRFHSFQRERETWPYVYHKTRGERHPFPSLGKSFKRLRKASLASSLGWNWTWVNLP